ncbi:hypothetical protein BG004_005980 [Podila humilis]|nr:hypothetical protein BG004_005980 [Podila humilis]
MLSQRNGYAFSNRESAAKNKDSNPTSLSPTSINRRYQLQPPTLTLPSFPLHEPGCPAVSPGIEAITNNHLSYNWSLPDELAYNINGYSSTLFTPSTTTNASAANYPHTQDWAQLKQLQCLMQPEPLEQPQPLPSQQFDMFGYSGQQGSFALQDIMHQLTSSNNSNNNDSSSNVSTVGNDSTFFNDQTPLCLVETTVSSDVLSTLAALAMITSPSSSVSWIPEYSSALLPKSSAVSPMWSSASSDTFELSLTGPSPHNADDLSSSYCGSSELATADTLHLIAGLTATASNHNDVKTVRASEPQHQEQSHCENASAIATAAGAVVDAVAADVVAHARESTSAAAGKRKREGDDGNTQRSETRKLKKEKKAVVWHACHIENCSKMFNRKSNLKSHLMTHDNVRKHICPQCDVAFLRVYDLDRHIRSHTKEVKYACKFQGCTKGYGRSDQLKRHAEKHH